MTVTDAGGNPLPGVDVAFRVTGFPTGATGQTLSVTNLASGPDGTASSILILGSELGAYTVTASLTGTAISPVVVTATAANNGWTEVWSDEFSYHGLPDSNKWNYENGYVRNLESQYYTTNRLANSCVTNGMLEITARKEQYYLPAQYTNIADYTSASMITQDKESWTYGRIEMRAKLPGPVNGVWPAFWMLGTNITSVDWPACGEIDILEYIGRNPIYIHVNSFYGSNGIPIGHSLWYQTPTPPYQDFHVYAIEWSRNAINFFYDNTNCFTYPVDLAGIGPDNPFRQAQYFLINFALGGAFGGSIDDASLPQQYLVDYVRVYQKIPAWTGLTSNSLWSAAGNWTNSVPPEYGDAVIFTGQTFTNSYVDSTFSQAAVTFYAMAGSYALEATNGGVLTLTRGINNYSANAQTVNVPIVLAADGTFNTDLGGVVIGGPISGTGLGLSKIGPGTLTFRAANTYSGATTIAAGTLALSPGGSLATSSINLAAGATFDVSALGNYGLPGNTWLDAAGNGVVIGASAANLKGGANNVVSLGSNPINLVYDGTNPSLYVSQGSLSLDGNPFTVNTTSGNALPSGTYTVITQAAGNILSHGYFPAAGGTASSAGKTGIMIVSNNTVQLIITNTSPVMVNAPARLPDGTIRLNFTGGNAFLNYRVQVNTNLTTTNWTTLSTNAAGSSGLTAVIDVAATNNRVRFYRTVTP